MHLLKSCTALLFLSAFALCGAEPQIKVALAGSSACQGYKSKDPKHIYGWGEFLGDYFTPNVKVLNFAISGTSTTSFRKRGYWKKLLASKPDYVFMTLGANDTPGKSSPSDPNTTYKENLRRYAAEARAAGAKVIFVTLNQALARDKKLNKVVFRKKSGPYVLSRVPYCKAMREVAAELKAPCLELAENQGKIYEAMGEEEAGKLYRVRPDGSYDSSHTNKAGAQLLAKIIITELRKSNSELKKYTIDPKLTYPVKKNAPAAKK